jgi:3-oxoacyl-[acyl-carrier protein] reductase
VRLASRVAIITGAGRGIGATTARKLANEGALVAIVDLDSDKATRVAADLRRDGFEAVALFADVTNKTSVQRMVSDTVDRFARVDILVNNAGIVQNRPLVEMTEQEWSSVIDVSLKGSFLCCQAVAPHMIRQRFGKIVNLSSVSAYGAVTPGQANYASAKAGLLGQTRTLAMELGPYNINVNAVAPGFIESEMTRLTARLQGLDFDEFKASRAAGIPLRRVGSPEDVANAICFLVSEEASYIHGEVINVAGGPTRSF